MLLHLFFVVRLATAQSDLLLFIRGKPALLLAHSLWDAAVRWTGLSSVNSQRSRAKGEGYQRWLKGAVGT